MILPKIACAVRAVARFCENIGLVHKIGGAEGYAIRAPHEGMGDLTYDGQGCELTMET